MEVAVIEMNDVNKTLYIPLYGKSKVSKQGIILKDAMAEKIWELESFMIKGKSKLKWLSYNMAMRARIFDDWTKSMLRQDKDALVLHIGCGLDSRCIRINELSLSNIYERRKHYRKKFIYSDEQAPQCPWQDYLDIKLRQAGKSVCDI